MYYLTAYICWCYAPYLSHKQIENRFNIFSLITQRHKTYILWASWEPTTFNTIDKHLTDSTTQANNTFPSVSHNPVLILQTPPPLLPFTPPLILPITHIVNKRWAKSKIGMNRTESN